MRIPRKICRLDFRRSIVFACISAILMSSVGGCHRSMYRMNADSEAYCLIQEKTSPECWPIPGYTIEPRPESRMFDPFDRDFPPMPPDDPTSHRLMHQVDCQEGYGCWHINGDTNYTANPEWWSMLPLTETGAIAINSESAIQLALTHSPVYQNEVEDLYLSALDVSFERFQFDAQYFAGLSSFFTVSGGSNGQSSTQYEINSFSSRGGNRLLRTQMTASGAQLAVGLANSLIWELSGNDTRMGSSLLDFSIVQPLLRGAGRDVVLERLTQSERSLLANVRQMERFRREFYVEVVAGRSATGGPTRTGPTLGSLNGLTNTAGNGGGLLGLLQSQQDIRNQRANVAALQSSVAQLEAFFVAGRIDYFQVELARQALYGAQSRLLAAERNLEANLDQFKLTLGLPPGVELDIAETMIEPFQLVDPEIVPLQDQLTRLQQVVGQTLSQLYERVTVPASLTKEQREELPLPPQLRKKAEDAAAKVAAKKEEANNDGELPGPADADNESDNATDDADDFLDDPDEEIKDPANPSVAEEDDGASDDSEEEGKKEDEEDKGDSEKDDSKKDEREKPTGPQLAWDEDVAAALQSLKRNVALARQSIKQAAGRHTSFARKDIQELRGSLDKRNRDASKLQRQMLQRMRKEQAARKEQRSSTSDPDALDSLLDEVSGADDSEKTDDPSADTVTMDDVRDVLPYRPGRLKQLPTVLEDTIADILNELKKSDKAFEKTAKLIDELLEGGEKLTPGELFTKFQDDIFVAVPSQLNNLAASILSITLAQARARTESIALPSVDLDWGNAVSMARCNRLDWMNARAGIVDTWRQVQVTANDLESQLDVIVDGDIGESSTLRFGLEFDSPITRLSERNTYRESLINYQRARRTYYQYEDRVATSLRDILRRLRINQINFELQRAAVDVAISQVELARLRLQEPPKPGEQPRFGATTARDLVQALNGLLSAQNDFLDVWISQEVLRRSLDLDLGTMQLDFNGMWIDPGDRLGWNENSVPFDDQMPGEFGADSDETSFVPDTEAEIIELPPPDAPAQIVPLPDADARVLPPPPRLLPSPNYRAIPSIFQPRTVQPVTYAEPIVDADSQ